MAWGIDGMIEAYKNNKQWSVHHELRKDLGDPSILGHRGWIPGIHKVWNGLTRPFAVAGGFFGLTGNPDVPEVTIPDAMKDTTMAEDIKKYQEIKTEEIALRTQSFGMKLGGLVTFNFGKINDGMLLDRNADHARNKGNDVIRQWKKTPPAGEDKGGLPAAATALAGTVAMNALGLNQENGSTPPLSPPPSPSVMQDIPPTRDV